MHLLNTADSLRLQAKITYLINFIRYHFADNSMFVDNSVVPSTEFVTASYDNVKGLFCKINMQRPQSGVLQVKDANGGDWITAEGNVNILARDVSCSKTPAKQTTMNGITIDGSSFAVIHQIPVALNSHAGTNRYDTLWTGANAKKKLAAFRRLYDSKLYKQY